MPAKQEAPQVTDKKYSEQDILLLIKFIVKEFAKIVQKWRFPQTMNYPMFGLTPAPQPMLNSLLISSLLRGEVPAMQSQEMITQNLLQQINPKILLDMLDQNRNNSGVNSPGASSRKVSCHSHLTVPEPKESQDDIKSPEVNQAEVKDDADTIQSSEDKTHRQRSSSDLSSGNSKKIDLQQAYSILNNNSILNSLIKDLGGSNAPSAN